MESSTSQAGPSVALVSMPWMAAGMPSIQLATLAAALQEHGIAADPTTTSGTSSTHDERLDDLRQIHAGCRSCLDLAGAVPRAHDRRARTTGWRSGGSPATSRYP